MDHELAVFAMEIEKIPECVIILAKPKEPMEIVKEHRGSKEICLLYLKYRRTPSISEEVISSDRPMSEEGDM
jgi:hypothetical protein